MPGATLSQSEADALLAMEKHRADEVERPFPSMGGAIRVPLTSADRREAFVLDVSRGRIDLAKATFQNRAREIVVLARLDVNGPPHRNPDGTEIGSPHLHLYREGYADKWAVAAPAALASGGDHISTLDAFLGFCNVVTPPLITTDLFT